MIERMDGRMEELESWWIRRKGSLMVVDLLRAFNIDDSVWMNGLQKLDKLGLCPYNALPLLDGTVMLIPRHFIPLPNAAHAAKS